MQAALVLAKEAETLGEVPIGALIVQYDRLIGQGHNSVISCHDPSAHAEIVALRDAGRAIENYRMLNSTLYVTLEPCSMCIGAIIHARVGRLVFGAFDPKTGAAGSRLQLALSPFHNHSLEISGGVLEEACSQLLKDFFASRR